MSNMSHKKRDILQNAAIAALVCLAAVLLFGSQTAGNGASPLGSLLSGSGKAASASDSSTLVRAALPMHIIIRNGDESSGYLNVTSSDAVFENLGTVLKEAVGSAGTQSQTDEQDFREALQRSSVCFDFFSPLPTQVIAEWLGLSGENMSHSAELLLVSGDTGGPVRLYAASPDDGTYYVWSTAASYRSLLRAVSPYTENNARFAFSDSGYSGISPYTVIPDVLPSLASLSASSRISADTTGSLLALLGFNAHSNTKYAESNGTEVIIDGSRTLRISSDGLVSCDMLSDGNDSFSARDANGDTTVVSAVSAVWKLAGGISSVIGSDIYIAGCSETDNGFTVSIGYRYGGYPIASPDGAAMKFSVENGKITSFSALCRGYVSSETASHLLPARQAAAAAAKGSLLTIGYFDSGSSADAAWLT
jgi:hypothetical protein